MDFIETGPIRQTYSEVFIIFRTGKYAITDTLDGTSRELFFCKGFAIHWRSSSECVEIDFEITCYSIVVHVVLVNRIIMSSRQIP